MSYGITQFANNLQNSLLDLDVNFSTFGALVPIPCGVSGTNTLTLTQNTGGQVPTPTITGYSTNMLFNGIAASTNTGSVTATVGSTGAVPVYKDNVGGPVALTGGEIVAGCAISLRYDAALNAGSGGFHLISNTASVGNAISPASVRINNGATLTNLLAGSQPFSFTATPGWSSQDVSFSLTGAAASIPLPGDFIQVSPPGSLAANVVFSGFVSGAGSLSSNSSAATVVVRLLNAGSASVAASAGTYRYLATRTSP